MFRFLIHVGLIGTMLMCVACAQAPPPKVAKKPQPVAEAEPEETPEGQLDRRELEGVLRLGPPWLLQRVPIEEVLNKGKFVGWRVNHWPRAWQHLDLRVGDVVTAVNGMALETPDDFWSAWTTLTVASEVKVAYLRDGDTREFSVPIWGAPGNVELNNPRPASSDARPKVRRKKTIVIRPPARPQSDTMGDW